MNPTVVVLFICFLIAIGNGISYLTDKVNMYVFSYKNQYSRNNLRYGYRWYRAGCSFYNGFLLLVMCFVLELNMDPRIGKIIILLIIAGIFVDLLIDKRVKRNI